ncbi:MAG: DUF2235 domain-containing protein [Gammaproteobacteria bacterium]|nr:DUF2235 domain-containing protein [Gammaproteobacteria bacterium]
MKRIVICADGTWNIRDQIDKKTGKRRPTNVTKLARAIKPRSSQGVDQIVYYHDGIGTGGFTDRFTGGAFGHGIEENIRNLYRFIVYNYEQDDELYFFGFSRGAFTVRSLAGFMYKIGLIEKDDDYYVPEIYACYERNDGPDSPQWKKAFRKVKGTRPCPLIRMIGVWDTVGALGAPGLLGQIFNKKKYQYHAVGLHSKIENAIHAIAVDEKRKPFVPDIWRRPADWSGQLVQAWFPGVHSNVGGSYDPDGLANESLHWIVEHAEVLGLEVDNNYIQYFRPCFNSVLNDSMTTMYRVMGPITRKIGQYTDSCEVLHQTCIDRMHHSASHYSPENLGVYLEKSPNAKTVNTTRIVRGKPCV